MPQLAANHLGTTYGGRRREDTEKAEGKPGDNLRLSPVAPMRGAFRGREDLVAGEGLGPVADVLVQGEDDGALLVASADEAEEEVRLLALEEPEAWSYP